MSTIIAGHFQLQEEVERARRRLSAAVDAYDAAKAARDSAQAALAAAETRVRALDER